MPKLLYYMASLNSDTIEIILLSQSECRSAQYSAHEILHSALMCNLHTLASQYKHWYITETFELSNTHILNIQAQP